MRKNVGIFLLVILVVCAVLLAVIPAWRHAALGYVKQEPRQEGLPASYWVYTAGNGDEKTRAHALHVLSQFEKEAPPSAIPVLLAALRDDNPLMRQYAAEALGKSGAPSKEATSLLVAALKDENAAVGSAAAGALAQLKPDDDTIVPVLIEILRNPAYRRTRLAAILAIGHFGVRAEPAVPFLIEVLQEQDGNLAAPHLMSVLSLAKIGQSAYPAILKALTHDKPRIRLGSVQTLIYMGSDAKPAIPALTERLQDPDAAVRIEAARAIWKIDGKAEPGLPVLLRIIQPGEGVDDRLRTQAAFVLGEIGPKAKAALPFLLPMMGHEMWQAREVVAEALGNIGPDQEAEKVLTEALQDEAPEVQKKAKEALEKAKSKG